MKGKRWMKRWSIEKGEGKGTAKGKGSCKVKDISKGKDGSIVTVR